MYFRVAALPENLPELDWAHYKARLPALASTVNDFEQKVIPNSKLKYKNLNFFFICF